MKIVSSFIERSEIKPLVLAGADELYTAVPNLPSFTSGCLSAGLPAAFREIHSLGKKALVALNSMSVIRSEAGMSKLADAVFRLEEEGADAFIISSPALLSRLRSGRRLKAGVHLSSVQPCFNTAALRFFLRLGITRLILPSQLAPLEAREMLRLCREEGVETEIFDYRFFGCVYVNGRCNLHLPKFHTFVKGGKGGALCRCGVSAGELMVKPFGIQAGRAAEAPALARRVARRMGGGGAPRLYNAASFYDFFRLGVGWLKYGVRLDPPSEKVRKVRALKEMSGMAAALSAELGPAASRAEFIRRMTAWRGE